MTRQANCPHEKWKGDQAKPASGLTVAVCRRCGARMIPGSTEFSALPYMNPNRLRDMALDEPERYRKLVEKADGYQAEAVKVAKAREARANARRNPPASNGKRH